MRAIVLHKVLRDAVPAPTNVVHADFTDTDDVNENQHVEAPQPTPAESMPVVVNVECTRCFNPRRETRGPGTRLTFIDGGGYAVTETFEEVQQLLLRSGVANIVSADEASGLIGRAN